MSTENESYADQQARERREKSLERELLASKAAKKTARRRRSTKSVRATKAERAHDSTDKARRRRERGYEKQRSRRKLSEAQIFYIREAWIMQTARAHGITQTVTPQILAGRLGITAQVVLAVLRNDARNLPAWCKKRVTRLLAAAPRCPSLVGDRIRDWYFDLYSAGRLHFENGTWRRLSTGLHGVNLKIGPTGKRSYVRAMTATERKVRRRQDLE